MISKEFVNIVCLASLLAANAGTNITLITKNSWGSSLQTASTITEKEQLLCNTHNDTSCQIMFMPFHQPGTGR